MTPLPEPPPPAGQLSEAWAERIADAIDEEFDLGRWLARDARWLPDIAACQVCRCDDTDEAGSFSEVHAYATMQEAEDALPILRGNEAARAAWAAGPAIMLIEALRPFALADNIDSKLLPKDRIALMRKIVTAEHFREARLALASLGGSET